MTVEPSYNFTDFVTENPDKLGTEPNIPYTVFEILVAICAIVGNLMVIYVFNKERRLRRRTNYYIVSLATADFLVGLLGIPFAILASVGLPTNLYACLFTVSLLVVLCTISIFCLVAVSVDRYWAILHPMAYSRNVRTKTAIVIISMCWLAGTVVGFLPLFGWHRGTEPYGKCLFEEVMDYNYLVFLYFATIITPSLLLAAFYAHIYRVIIKQLRQIVTMNPLGGSRNSHSSSRTSSTSLRPPGGTMLRVLGAAQKREVKATQNLSIIVLFFMICWIPLYTINCVKAFCPQCHVNETFTFFCIILSHLNSAVNPLLYAYHLRDFRAALKSCILRMFGIPEPSVPDLHCRPSLASGHQRFQCQREKRLSLQPRIYIDSPVWLRSRAAENANRVPAISCSLNSIHQTVTGAIGAGDREMWKISEVPSLAEEASRDSAMAKDNISVISKVVDHDLSHSNSSSNISHKLNAMYLGDIYDYDDDDDDVFMPATPSLSRSDLGEPFSTELPFSGCSRHDSVSSLTVQIDNQIISRRSTPQLTDNSDSDSTHLSPRDKLNPIVTPLDKSPNDIMTSPTKHRSLRVVSDFLLQPSIKQYFQNHRNGSATKPAES